MFWTNCRQLFVFRLLWLGASLLPFQDIYTQAAKSFRKVNAESRTGHAFEEARKQGPLAVRAFLYQMPKGRRFACASCRIC